MNFKERMMEFYLPYALYPIYNWLAVHDAPLFILDLFLPILTTETWKQALQNEIKNAKVFKTVNDFLADLHNKCQKPKYPRYLIYGNTVSGNNYSLILTGATSNTFYNNTCTASNSNGIWLYGSADGNQT